MRINHKIMSEILNNHNQITTRQVSELGISRQTLSMYVKENLLVRARRGTYILPDSIHDDMYTLSLRSENIVFSHESALFLNGLSDRTPFCHYITLPSGATVPHSIRNECQTFFIKPSLFTVGLTEIKTPLGSMVKCYNAERTVCDMLRSKRRFEIETVVSAVKNYVKGDSVNFKRLYEYSTLFKVEGLLRNYLEVLQ